MYVCVLGGEGGGVVYTLLQESRGTRFCYVSHITCITRLFARTLLFQLITHTPI